MSESTEALGTNINDKDSTDRINFKPSDQQIEEYTSVSQSNRSVTCTDTHVIRESGVQINAKMVRSQLQGAVATTCRCNLTILSSILRVTTQAISARDG
jgi:hypothetical protein